jgi:aminoglycoside 2''-phosphotransferase
MSAAAFPGLATPRDHAAASALLADCLPEGRHQRLVPLGEGEFCLAFRDSTRILRVAKHAEAALALRAEACVLSEIADHLPVPVPRPAFRAPEGGPAFSIHEEVRGEVLTRESWLELPPVQRNRAAADLASLLRALHGLPLDAGRRCGLLRVLEVAGFARRLLEQAPGTLYPLLDPDTRQRLDDVLTRCSAGGRYDRATVLIHCDIASGHLLFDPADGRLTGIIDFGDLALGDPARDFIYIYEEFAPEMLAAVLSAYGREEASVLLPRVRLWYLLEAVSWTIRMHVGAEEAAIREGLHEIRRELTNPAPIGR